MMDFRCTFFEVEPHLMAEYTEGARARTVAFFHAFLQYSV